MRNPLPLLLALITLVINACAVFIDRLRTPRPDFSVFAGAVVPVVPVVPVHVTRHVSTTDRAGTPPANATQVNVARIDRHKTEGSFEPRRA
ncbi:hypothetical protein ACFXDJ_10310 [Streptomyces sp. NPDC059443]|uniref:hypothetical protein n=1 Tax=unclassified Streptomyces TaxID=2593676 RepID=UPI0036CDB003